MDNIIKKTRFKISGMDCASCAAKVETAVRRVRGVDDVLVSVTTESMTLTHGDDLDQVSLQKRVRSLGYGIEQVVAMRPVKEDTDIKTDDHVSDHGCCGGHSHSHDNDHEHNHEKVTEHKHSHEGCGCSSGDIATAPLTTDKNLVRFTVEGMDCASCAAKIDTAVRRINGVADVSVSVTNGTMAVSHDGADANEISERVTRLGYKTVIIAGDMTSGMARAEMKRAAPERWWQTKKGQQMLLTGGALIIAYGLGYLFPAYELFAFTVAMLIGLIPIAKRAFMAAINGTPFSIEMLMTIAAVGALFIGATEEAAAVVFLFLIGELLEGVAAGKARSSIQALTDLVPTTAFIERSGISEEVPADNLKVGDIIVVRPGDRMPADGKIISGGSSVDEAPVTGESTPVYKSTGEAVFAGTINGEAVLRVEVTAAAQDNTIARVVQLVEQAQEAKAPTERFINRFSTYYTPFVVLVAALVAIIPPLLFGALWDEWIYKGLAILLIGCPCALVISTPAAIAASLSSGARRGLLMKGGAVLEIAGKITAVALDKTGTLTEGRPKVTDVVGAALDEQQVLRLAAALDAGSSHPLALAILNAAEAQNITWPVVTDGRAIGGKGVAGEAEGSSLFLGSPKAAAAMADLGEVLQSQISAMNDEGKTVSVLVVDGKIAGAIAMRDEPRSDAKSGLKRLTDAGIRTIMLTGDNRRTAQAVGRDLGIEVRAELLPEDKQKIVRELKEQGLIVAKVGDGINDAPALATADIGIAMGGGTDVALETADAAILHGRVSDIAAMIDLSKRTMLNIYQNIGISLGLKAVFFVTTIAGITGLWPAILADTGATVLVTLNALRLLRKPAE